MCCLYYLCVIKPFSMWPQLQQLYYIWRKMMNVALDMTNGMRPYFLCASLSISLWISFSHIRFDGRQICCQFSHTYNFIKTFNICASNRRTDFSLRLGNIILLCTAWCFCSLFTRKRSKAQTISILMHMNALAGLYSSCWLLPHWLYLQFYWTTNSSTNQISKFPK